MQPKAQDLRLAALWRFAGAITLFNLLGHTVFGFEQAWAHPLVALATGYAVELILASLDAFRQGQKPRFLGVGFKGFVEFLLPTHITALAIGMLLYSNGRFMPVAYATAVAIASKYIFRVMVGGRPRHFLNPSNFGITVALLSFHWVGISPPYMFTENLHHGGDLILPLVLVSAGSFLNYRFTRKLPLILTWLAAFALQAVARSLIFGTPVAAALMPMTGMSLLLFTFYMVSDPSTTPSSTRGQMIFAASVAFTYSLLMSLHVVFTMFFALTLVCVGRGIALYAGERLGERASRPATVPMPAGEFDASASGAAGG